jgi:uncharacterized protein YjbI with pentapeptide repeats
MGQPIRSTVLKALLGKKIMFQGKFEYGERERLSAMAEAQQGLIVEELEASVDYLVLADLAGGKAVQKKVASLNAKGAVIQVVDGDAFQKLIEPTKEQVLELIRGGKENAAIFVSAVGATRGHFHHRQSSFTPLYTFAAEKLDGLDLLGFNFNQIAFEQCSFVGAKLTRVSFVSARGCDFSGADAGSASFGDVDGSRFVKANLKAASFQGGISKTDFTAAILEEAAFTRDLFGPSGPKQLATPGCVFAKSSLRSAKFADMSLTAPDFDGAELSGSIFSGCHLDAASFRKSVLEDATLVGCSLVRANLTGAVCTRASFAEADLTEACVDHADLTECDLRGAKLQGVDFAKAKVYKPDAVSAGSAGPALAELDTLANQARRIKVTFHVRMESTGEEMEVGINSSGLKYGWGVQLPYTFPAARHVRARNQSGRTFSGGMLQLSNILVNRKVRYETVEIQSSKSPKAGKDLRELVLNGIAEAFAQPLPVAEDLAAATKAHREQSREQQSADRERREAAKKLAEKQQVTAKKRIAKKIAKEVGKVVDIATFLKALELRADKQKIDKATKMLKASGFQLFNDVTDDHLNGVVKSQTDPDLVYACRIESSGDYACCTQNLNICGGLRGSICKHLLVLIIGLVKAGELDPSAIDGWIAKSHDTKPELNKETMGEIFIRYKGAEAGEVDWRPTETVPEDYYTL